MTFAPLLRGMPIAGKITLVNADGTAPPSRFATKPAIWFLTRGLYWPTSKTAEAGVLARRGGVGVEQGKLLVVRAAGVAVGELGVLELDQELAVTLRDVLGLGRTPPSSSGPSSWRRMFIRSPFGRYHFEFSGSTTRPA